MGTCASRLSASASFAALYELDDKHLLAERPFAEVYGGRYRATGAPVAIKRILKERPPPSSFSSSSSSSSSPPSQPSRKSRSSDRSTGWEGELAAIRRCALPPHHPNVIRFECVFESRREVHVVMEHVGGGQLFDALISDGAYSEWDARRFVRDTLEALKYLHGRGVVHRNITPENLLFTTRNSKTASIKVVNFATARLLNDRATTALTLEQPTWPYCAPEILATIDSFVSLLESIPGARAGSATGDTLSANAAIVADDGEPASSRIANTTSTRRDRARSDAKRNKQAPDETKCDVWSVGIVLYVLLSGAHPFDLDGRQTRDQIVQNILRGTFSMSDESPMWSSVSREAKELLTLLLEVDPAKRPSAAEALDHAWFASPHTPHEPLAVSVSDGLGQYQRLMRKKFRSSVLAAMAVEVFRRSLKKQQEAAATAVGDGGSALQDGVEDGRRETQMIPSDATSEDASKKAKQLGVEYVIDALGTEDLGGTRPVEHTCAAKKEEPAPSAADSIASTAVSADTAASAGTGVERKQGSVLSRVFQRRVPSDSDLAGVNARDAVDSERECGGGGQGSSKEPVETSNVHIEAQAAGGLGR